MLERRKREEYLGEEGRGHRPKICPHGEQGRDVSNQDSRHETRDLMVVWASCSDTHMSAKGLGRLEKSSPGHIPSNVEELTHFRVYTPPTCQPQEGGREGDSSQSLNNHGIFQRRKKGKDKRKRKNIFYVVPRGGKTR